METRLGFGPLKAYQLDFGKYLGSFVEDVPDEYLVELMRIIKEEENKDKRLKQAVDDEIKYRKTYKKWVSNDGVIRFGKGFSENSKIL